MGRKPLSDSGGIESVRAKAIEKKGPRKVVASVAIALRGIKRKIVNRSG